MNNDEREQFDKITGQPEMRELRREPLNPRALRIVYFALAGVIVAGGLTSLMLLSWRVAVATVIVAFGLVLVAGAVSTR